MRAARLAAAALALLGAGTAAGGGVEVAVADAAHAPGFDGAERAPVD